MVQPSQSIGSRIRQARRRLGVSQEHLAQSCEMRATTVSRHETGRAVPGGVALVRLALALGVTAEWLVFGDSMPTNVVTSDVTATGCAS